MSGRGEGQTRENGEPSNPGEALSNSSTATPLRVTRSRLQKTTRNPQTNVDLHTSKVKILPNNDLPRALVPTTTKAAYLINLLHLVMDSVNGTVLSVSNAGQITGNTRAHGNSGV